MICAPRPESTLLYRQRISFVHLTVNQSYHLVLFDHCVSCADEPLSIDYGFCLALLRAHIRRNLWCHLPSWFLNNGIVDSYEGSDLLKETHGVHIGNIFVIPSAAKKLKLDVTPKTELGQHLTECVPDVIIHLYMHCWHLKS